MPEPEESAVPAAAPVPAARPVSASKIVYGQAMDPALANPFGTVHGGEIMKLVDSAGGSAAIKHAGRVCVTASVDRMDFIAPVRVGDFVHLLASVNYVHRTSMEVGVRVDAEELASGRRRHVASAYLIFVAIDEAGRRVTVPPLIAETQDERRRMAAAEERYRLRQQLRERSDR